MQASYINFVIGLEGFIKGYIKEKPKHIIENLTFELKL